MATDHSIQTDENWRHVRDYEGVYEVSELGKVRRIGKAHGSTRGLVLRWSFGRTDYPRVCLSKNHQARTVFVHRLVADAFIGPCPSGHEINHRDGNKRNPNAANLEYVTRSGNLTHAYQIGAMQPTRGELSGKARLREADVREIRSSSASQSELALRFGTSPAYIGHIRSRRRWAHVED